MRAVLTTLRTVANRILQPANDAVHRDYAISVRDMFKYFSLTKMSMVAALAHPVLKYHLRRSWAMKIFRSGETSFLLIQSRIWSKIAKLLCPVLSFACYYIYL